MTNDAVSTDPGSPGKLVDCRVWERLSCDLDATFSPIAAPEGDNRPWHGIIRDISRGGAGLVLNRPFETGTALTIEVVGPDGLILFLAPLARVVHTTRLAEDTWLMGCAFIREVSSEEMQPLLDPTDSTP